MEIFLIADSPCKLCKSIFLFTSFLSVENCGLYMRQVHCVYQLHKQHALHTCYYVCNLLWWQCQALKCAQSQAIISSTLINYRSVTSSKFRFCIQHFHGHISVEHDKNPSIPNFTWIGSWGLEIWPHEYLFSHIECSVNWPGS